MIKGYSGVFRLGEATSTWDADSPVCFIESNVCVCADLPVCFIESSVCVCARALIHRSVLLNLVCVP